MLTNARQKMIENIAMRDGEVVISRVAKELGVSIETVRRDINVMCAHNILTKVHGGAVPAQAALREAEYSQRKKSNHVVKAKLGEKAAELIKDHQVVAISTGSTLEAVAAGIKGVRDISVLTNSLPIGETLSSRFERGEFDGKVVLFGGQLHMSERLTYGAEVLEQVRNYFTDIVFISAAAVYESSLMSTNTEEGNIMTEMMKYSSRIVLVIESKKLGKHSVYRYGDLSKVDTIVTDTKYPVSREIQAIIKEHEIELITVEC